MASAVAGAWAVVNAVSLYVESGNAHFTRSTWKPLSASESWRARQAWKHSCIFPESARTRVRPLLTLVAAVRERAVLDAYPSADLVRPAVMFGPGDAFLTPLLAMLRRMPVFPMFGSGATRLQPAYVEDVAEAIVRILRAPAARQFYELAGPRDYTYQELLRTIAARAGITPFLVPFPFSVWHIIGHIAEALPTPPLTRNQVELMGRDNITDRTLQASRLCRSHRRRLPQMLQLARKEAQV